MKCQILFTKRVVCNFLSEIIFVLLPIFAILGITVHRADDLGSLLSGKEMSVASILLCGSAIRRRYMINYPRIGQRQTEDLFTMDILIAFLTASSLLFSFVILGNQQWQFIGPAQVVMLLAALSSVYVVCQVEEKTHQYLRIGPLKGELGRFFHAFRGELVHLEGNVNDCAKAALRITDEVILEDVCCLSNQHDHLESAICSDNIKNIKERFDIIRRRAATAYEHLENVKAVGGGRSESGESGA